MKQWRKLQQKKHREKTGLFIAEGERCVEQILKNGMIDVECLILNDEMVTSDLTGVISYSTEIYLLPAKEFDGLSDTENPQGIIAICHIPEEKPHRESADLKGLMIATDAVQDPGNLGTIIRTAAWFGVAGLFCGTGTVDPWHPKVVRSTAGATGAIPVWSGDLEQLLALLEEKGWRVLLLDSGDGSVSLREITQQDQTVVVVGNESSGIDPRRFLLHRQRVHIEGNAGTVESLNAAIALGIALYGLRG